MMPRLPIPGSDDYQWGEILNDFLKVEHRADGSLRLRDEGWVKTINGAGGPNITLTAASVGALDTTAGDNRYTLASSLGQNNGVATLDGAGRIPANAMRPFNERGVVAFSTTYNPWDVVIYNGRRILITSAVTTGASSSFISASRYISLDAIHKLKAFDYGYRADGSQASAAANLTAVQRAIDDAYAAGGGAILLPYGVAYINGTIELKDRVWLEGPAMFGATVALADNANCHVIKNHKSATGTASDRNAQFVGIMNLNIDGRKQAQSAGSWYGIFFDTNPFNTVGGDSYFDPTHLIQNVRVANTKSDGIHLNGRSDTRVIATKSSFAGGYGFRSSFDTHFIGCIAEKAAKAGFYIQNSSTQFSNCKAYTCGLGDDDQSGVPLDKNEGHGYVVNGNIGEIVFDGCDSQQNTGYGVYITGGARGVMWYGTVSEPSFQNGSDFAAICIDNASYCVVDATSVTHSNPTPGLLLKNGADRNIVRLTHFGTITGPAQDPLSVPLNNNIVINGDYIHPVVELRAQKGAANGYAALGPDGLVPAEQLPPGNGGLLANFGLGFFGDGSDGTATLDGTATYAWATLVGGNTYRITRNVNFTNLIINSGITLETRGFIVNVASSLSGNGTINNNGSNATSGSGAIGGLNGTIAGGKNGGAGGSSAAGTAGVNATSAFGGAGGGGGAGSSTAGGAGGTLTAPTASDGGTHAARILPWATAGHAIANNGIRQFGAGSGGGGGGGDGTNAGGGGGGSGGVLILNAKTISATAITIQSNGGNGFSPTTGNTGGGGGGGGGLVIINTTAAPTGLTTQANGGAGGTGHGTGSNGTNGAAGLVVTNIFS